MHKRIFITIAAIILLLIFAGNAYAVRIYTAGEGIEISVRQAVAEREARMIKLGFAGDFKTAEGETVTKFMDSQERGILDCIDNTLIEKLRGFDYFMLNNEFTYSDRGKPLAGKKYTFRAKPERVEILNTLGVDMVLLANNHIYDYGEEAFYDTLAVLDGAGIEHIGAGENIDTAAKVHFENIKGCRIGFIGASRAENWRLTPSAAEDQAGVFAIYDEAGVQLLLDAVEQAKAECDIMIVNVHWGVEYSNEATEAQRKLAYRLIDAGADAIIGSHPHVLQGLEYYKGKPVIYSLGNFWFNGRWLYTGILELDIDPLYKQLRKVVFHGCTQRDCYTDYPQDEAGKAEVIDFMQGISYDVKIDEQGRVWPVE